jgi:hypothetical protein
MSSKLKTSIKKRNKTYTKFLQGMLEGLLRYGVIDPKGKSTEESRASCGHDNDFFLDVGWKAS